MTRIAVCASYILCLLFGAMLAGRAASVSEYDKALSGVQNLLQKQAFELQGQKSACRDTLPIASQAERLLMPIRMVQARGHAPRPVETAVLRQDIQRATQLTDSQARALAYRQASEQIALLRQEMARTASLPSSKGQAALGTARSVLSRTEFASDPLPPPSAMDRLLKWLSRFLPKRHRRIGPEPSINVGFIRMLVFLLAAGAFALLVTGLARYLRHRSVASHALAPDEKEAALLAAQDAESLRAMAESCAGRREWRRAFRLTYLASLALLDRNGAIRYDRSKTNWEYLRMLRADGNENIFPVMQTFTLEFDRVWYGVAQATGDDYVTAVEQYDAIATTAEPRPAVRASS